jgi:phosphatidylserine/phosphatidylglycerophosphate/cardiolipin synthase-like enzyme
MAGGIELMIITAEHTVKKMRLSGLHLFGIQVALCLTISILSLPPLAQAEQFKSTGTVDVYFSPQGGTTTAVVNELDNAKQEILVQAYSFTSAPLAKALLNAHKRGVHVEVVLDRSQRSQKYSSADFMAHAGIPTYIDSAHAIAHNKIMIIDRSTLITGSYNFTKAAEENNAENLLIIKGNKPLVDRYIRNLYGHKQHSDEYMGLSGR